MAAQSKPGFPLLSYQPLRLLYQTQRLVLLLIRLPVWSIRFLFPSLRPHPEWTFKQALLARLIRFLVHGQSTVGITQRLSLVPGPEGDRFEVISPFPTDLYRGPLASNNEVQPVPIGGTWYPSKPSSPSTSPPSKVILLLHGGAFVQGDGRTDWSGFTASTLVSSVGPGTFVFAPQYRLSSYNKREGNPFPAALQDALTAYLHLVRTLHIPPERIVLAGDSAGGNLAVALLRYIEREIQTQTQTQTQDGALLRPSCAVLISPWVDPLAALSPSDAVYTTQASFSTDLLPVSFLRWGARTYTSSLLAATSQSEILPYIKPLGNPFSTPTPLFVVFGEIEMLEGDGTAWAGEMRAMQGNTVEVVYEKRALHDTLLLAGKAGWEESARWVAGRVAEFVGKYA